MKVAGLVINRLYLLSFDSGNTGKRFAFKVFKHCATAGGHITYFISKAKLVDSRHRIPPPTSEKAPACVAATTASATVLVPC